MGRVSVCFDFFLYGNFSRAKIFAARLMGNLSTLDSSTWM